MKRDLQNIAQQEYDVVIIGGGINGAGILRDATYRGLRALLVEKNDFCSGTSSTSSKLIHGGLRYLEQFDIGLVRESLREREILKNIAPHLVKEIPFLFPIYKGFGRKKITIKTGMMLYDLLSFDKSIPRHQMLNKKETLAKEPLLKEKDLIGAALYHDCQLINPERFCLENILDACEKGADALNYMKVKELEKRGGKIQAVVLHDELSGQELKVCGKYVVNAAGPWIDDICKKVFENSKKIRGTKGVHLFVPQFAKHPLIANTSDNRIFFVIPWKGMTMIGTTDTDYKGDLNQVATTEEDISYLLDQTKKIFSQPVEKKDILYTLAGVRPLVAEEGNESSISRKHRIYDHSKEGYLNFISLGGGKITTYRQIAEDVVDLICKKMGKEATCTTERILLPGALQKHECDAELERALQKYGISKNKKIGITKEVIENLIEIYGKKYSAVLEEDLNNPLFKKMCETGRLICLCNNDLFAQVAYAVKNEKAQTLNDVIFRRLDIGNKNCFGTDSFWTIACLMQNLLGWNDQKRESEIENYRAYRMSRNVF